LLVFAPFSLGAQTPLLKPEEWLDRVGMVCGVD